MKGRVFILFKTYSAIERKCNDLLVEKTIVFPHMYHPDKFDTRLVECDLMCKKLKNEFHELQLTHKDKTSVTNAIKEECGVFMPWYKAIVWFEELGVAAFSIRNGVFCDDMRICSTVEDVKKKLIYEN